MLLPLFAQASTLPSPLRLPATLLAFMAQMALLHLALYTLVAIAANLFSVDASGLSWALIGLFLLASLGMGLAGAALLFVLVAQALGAHAAWERLRGTPLGRASSSLAMGGGVNLLVAGSVSLFVGPEEPQFVVLAWMGAALLLAASLCAAVALRRTQTA